MLQREVRGSRRRTFAALALVLPVAAIGAVAALAIVPRVALPRVIAHAAPPPKVAPLHCPPLTEPHVHRVVPRALVGAVANARTCTIAVWGGDLLALSRDDGDTFEDAARGQVHASVVSVAIDDDGTVYAARDDGTIDVTFPDGSVASRAVPIQLAQLVAVDGTILGIGREEIAESTDHGATWSTGDLPDPDQPSVRAIALDRDGTLWLASALAHATSLWRIVPHTDRWEAVWTWDRGGGGIVIASGEVVVISDTGSAARPLDGGPPLLLPRVREAASNGAVTLLQDQLGDTWQLDRDRARPIGPGGPRLLAVDPTGAPLYLDDEHLTRGDDTLFAGSSL